MITQLILNEVEIRAAIRQYLRTKGFEADGKPMKIQEEGDRVVARITYKEISQEQEEN